MLADSMKHEKPRWQQVKVLVLRCSAGVAVAAHIDPNPGQQGRSAIWEEREEDFCSEEEGRRPAEGEGHSQTRPDTGNGLLAENETTLKSEDGLWVSMSCSLVLEVDSSCSKSSC